MDLVFTPCAGLDVHQKTVTACRATPGPTGQPADGLMEVKELGTLTRDLLALADWLAEAGITPVAMASTGAYWKPVYHVLEGDLTVCLVNAAHVQQVPGRKTAKHDARWLATLMRHGLLQASCIPPPGPRDLRALTRDRTKLVRERRRAVNRRQGGLERADVKLAAAATDVMGVAGRASLAALVEGRAAPATMAELAQGRMRRTIPLLEQALTGLVRGQHRQLLARPLAPIDVLDEQIDARSAEIIRRVTPLSGDEPPSTPLRPPGEAGSAAGPGASGAPTALACALALLETMPGVGQRGGEMLGAEWGPDVTRFGTADRLAAWSGVAPGNDERAGKKRSGKTRQGNRTLRTGLTQLAHAAARTTGTYLAALYQRLAARRGKKRAIMAVAHAMVVSAFHRLARHEPYHELGANYLDAHRREQRVDRFPRRIERLGYRVTLAPVPAT